LVSPVYSVKRSRNARASGVIVAVLLVVAMVYVADPQVLGRPKGGGTPSSNGASSASLSAGATMIASSQASGGQSVDVTAATQGSSSPAGQAWTTYHEDNARDGFVSTNFTSASPAWTTPVDGATYAEPLLYAGEVFVATENNSVYALSGRTGDVVWGTNLGAPVQGSQLQCGDISPSGITGTPVIDPSTGTLFVVSFDESSFSHVLSALNTSSGAILWQKGANPPHFDATVHQERSALSLANGMVYIPYGGLDGDCGQYHGWVVGIPENGTGSMVYYQVPAGRKGGIWAPSGASVGA
jgi:outer membrane protein assembly factor BamB